MLYTHISELIGNTPLLNIPVEVHGIEGIELFAKLEYFNPFWSIKDRSARYMIKDHLSDIRRNKKIIESSSGNTAKSLSALGNTWGATTKTVTNRIHIPEHIDMLKLLGAQVQQLPFPGECIDFSQEGNPLQVIEQQCTQDDTRFHTDQYRNPANTRAHYETTWPEIYQDLGSVDYIFSGLWTTGSWWGITTFLKEKNTNLISIGIVSTPDDTIPGIRSMNEMFEVWLYDKSLYQGVYEVHSGDALSAMLTLNRKVGMLCWPTSWAVYYGILDYFRKNPIQLPPNSRERKKVVFPACDRVDPYLGYIKQRMPEIYHQHKNNLCILNIDNTTQEQYTKTISVHDVQTLLAKTWALVIDTRSNKPFILWHIEGSINIPYDILVDLTDKGKIFATTKPIILVCPTWTKTQKLSAYLNLQWYSAYNLEWGLNSRKINWGELVTLSHS